MASWGCGRGFLILRESFERSFRESSCNFDTLCLEPYLEIPGKYLVHAGNSDSCLSLAAVWSIPSVVKASDVAWHDSIIEHDTVQNNGSTPGIKAWCACVLSLNSSFYSDSHPVHPSSALTTSSYRDTYSVIEGYINNRDNYDS